jgi:hypothetical protein
MGTENPKQQPKLSSDSLLETSKKGDTELTEQELGKVSGGRKGSRPVEYMKVTLKDAIIG